MVPARLSYACVGQSVAKHVNKARALSTSVAGLKLLNTCAAPSCSLAPPTHLRCTFEDPWGMGGLCNRSSHDAAGSPISVARHRRPLLGCRWLDKGALACIAIAWLNRVSFAGRPRMPDASSELVERGAGGFL